jgi:hypothetical protein
MSVASGLLKCLNRQFYSAVAGGVATGKFTEEEFEPARGVSLKIHSPGAGNL